MNYFGKQHGKKHECADCVVRSSCFSRYRETVISEEKLKNQIARNVEMGKEMKKLKSMVRLLTLENSRLKLNQTND